MSNPPEKKKVKWADSSSWRECNLSERQHYLLKSGYRSDCTFLVGLENEIAEQFKCHKLILCHGSEAFDAMFYGNLPEHGIVKIEDIRPKYFEKMLEYVYTDNVDLENVETALGVYYAANKYLISRLCSKCHRFVKESLTVADVCKTLEFSRLISNQELEESCIQVLRHKTDVIMAANSFVDAELQTLLTILEQDKLNVTSEETLFSACLRWGIHHVTKRSSIRHVLEPVLPLIRFRAMSIEEFTEKVCNTKVLTEKEEHGIFMCHGSKTVKMPFGFSSKTESRGKTTVNDEVITLQHSPWSVKAPVTGSFMLKIYSHQNVNNIFIRGFRVKSRKEVDYEENVLIDYFDLNAQNFASTQFKGKVTANKDFDVFFDKPYPNIPAQCPQGRYYPRIAVSYPTCVGMKDSVVCFYSSDFKYVSKSGIVISITGKTVISAIYLCNNNDM